MARTSDDILFHRIDNETDVETNQASQTFFLDNRPALRLPVPSGGDKGKCLTKDSNIQELQVHSLLIKRRRAAGCSGGIFQRISLPQSAETMGRKQRKYQYRYDEGWNMTRDATPNPWKRNRRDREVGILRQVGRETDAIPLPPDHEYNQVGNILIRENFKNLIWVDELDKRLVQAKMESREEERQEARMVDCEIGCLDDVKSEDLVIRK